MFKRVLMFISYLIMFCFVLLLVDFYKQPLFTFLLMLILILPLASYLLCRYIFHKLTASISSNTAYGNTGDTILTKLVLNDSSLFPLLDCTLVYYVNNTLYPNNTRYEVNCPAYSKSDFSYNMPLTFHRCGCYQISIVELKVNDYLHFFEFKKKLTEKLEIIIYPLKNKELEFEATSYGEGFDEFEETSAKGNISSNVTDIREYIPGDRLQKIHWKLSAKINKLMVKENEQTASSQFTIIVELFQPDPSSDYLERTLSNAYTIAEELLKTGEAFFFTFYNIHLEDFNKSLIQNKDDLETAFLDCFYQSSYEQEDLALTVLQRAGLISGTILHITHKGVEDVIS